VSAFVGAMRVGAVPSFMPCPSAKQHPAIYWSSHLKLLQRIGRHLLVTDGTHAAQMRAQGLADIAIDILTLDRVGAGAIADEAPDVVEDDVAFLQHSSGTTALKKGVALSNRAVLRQIAAYSTRLSMGADDAIVSWLPIYHDMGLIACTIMPLVLGQTVTSIDPFQWVGRPACLFDAIERYNGQFAWLPNFAFEHLVRMVPRDYAADLSGMKAFINCSEPCKAETFDRFHDRFSRLNLRRAQLQVCYAMAETVFAVSQTAAGQPARRIVVDEDALRRDRVVAAPREDGRALTLLSAGAPLPGVAVSIRGNDPDAADREVGEIVVSGDFLFDGYLNDAETTQARLSNGRYHTRDLGFLYDGELYVLGREDDLIIINGRNIYAHEVEAVVGQISGVKPGRAVAFGVFNDAIGSQELVVVAERETDPPPVGDQAVRRAVRMAVLEQTGIEVKACRLEVPGWLVKTTSGKISREANRAKYLGESGVKPLTADAKAEDMTTLERLADVIAAQFKCLASAVKRATVADDIEGWDSLGHATLMLAVEKEFSIRFAESEMFSFANVGELADRVDVLRQEQRGNPSAPDRMVHESDSASIVRMGEAEGTSLVVFAGMALRFGGLDLLDFASTLNQTSARGMTKYFVTDRRKDFFVTCFDEVVEQLHRLSDAPRILVGNSMGGYATLRFAAALRHVRSALAFVPQYTAVWGGVRSPGKPKAFWDAHFAPGIDYCVVYGELEDEDNKQHLRNELFDPARQRILTVPNCGHNVVPYLNEIGLLAQVLDCGLRPATMADEIAAIIATIEPAPELLRARIALTERLALKRASQRAQLPASDRQRDGSN
jgi:acyl-CoA synthetase (AMP-forming)/AMP-acid ligase II/acyl carrier protein